MAPEEPFVQKVTQHPPKNKLRRFSKLDPHHKNASSSTLEPPQVSAFQFEPSPPAWRPENPKPSNVAELHFTIEDVEGSPTNNSPGPNTEKQKNTGDEQPYAWRLVKRGFSPGESVPKPAGGTSQPKRDYVPLGYLDLGQLAPEETLSLVPPVSMPDVYSVSQDIEEKNNEAPPNTSSQATANTHLTKPSPGTRDTDQFNVNKPTCSLNLVCYRSGQEGCKLQQVQCICSSKYQSQEVFLKALAANPQLVDSDYRFFCEIRRPYETKMCTFFRRYFSLKTLKGFRILAYTQTSRPSVVPFDGFVLQEIMYVYRNPNCLTGDEWIHWVFRLRRADKRHAVEFVEGWDSTRITIAAMFPLLSSCIIAIAWTIAGGDPQTTFTVASFILTCSSIILAVLAVVSSIKSSGNNDFK